MIRYSVDSTFNINDEINFNLKDWLHCLYNKLYILIVALILGSLFSFFITKFYIVPIYISETEVYIMAKQDSNTNITFNDLELSSQLSSDYIEFALSRPVINAVKDQLNFNITTEQIEKSITIKTAANARILHISVKNANAKHAQEIANSIREATNQRFTEIVGTNSATTLEEANLPSSPSEPNLILNIISGGAIGFIVACIIISLFYICDDTLKTPDDIENYLNLNVLASIPFLKKDSFKNISSKNR